MTENADYNEVQEALVRADANAGASEAHGILCGMMCMEQGADRAAWFKEVFGADQAAGNLLVQEAARQLDIVLEDTLSQVRDGMLGLRLLLPDDEQPLPGRVAALSAWCEGFLLGSSRMIKSQEPSPEVRELLSDLIEITKVDSRDLDEGQQDERSYAEVVEYVRMGVLLAFEQAGEADPVPPASH